MKDGFVSAPILKDGYTFSVVPFVSKETKEHRVWFGPFFWTTKKEVEVTDDKAVIVKVKYHGDVVGQTTVRWEVPWYIGDSFEKRIASAAQRLSDTHHRNNTAKRVVKSVLGDYPPKKVIG